MSYSEASKVLVLIIVIYFLFRLGVALIEEGEGYFWVIALLCLAFGWNALDDKSPYGFLGFIPIMTHIVLKILCSTNMEQSVRKKTQGIALSSGTSVVAFMVTHSIFGFGVSEASISAVITAAVLGFAGYSS